MAWEEHGLTNTEHFHVWRKKSPLEKKEERQLVKAIPGQKKRSSDNQVNKASSNQWKVTRKLQYIEDANHLY